ncbi:Tubulin-specific chaperone E [Erysiphe neolycopersici]|uniref:Tubulin-specific chaperone E n=1 Tax=Erysiphe neolycopersici TaxID=212602 RepID=A0A420HMV4_9PEZI|nr:Tubulin-specific chaperone E [Erysiphe neolycopersici]
MREYRIGDRISYSSKFGTSEICTLRYIGEVDGHQGQWFGVEWDDANRGKHDGSLDGKRYFSCHSPSSTAGSFVRPSRPTDPERSFIEAIYDKYAAGETSLVSGSSSKEIIISGKVAQEVGFDKIREIQSRLHEIKIVILDGMRISVVERDHESIYDTCPKIVELDLGRNLFRCFTEISVICSKLPNLKELRLNGNRISDTEALCPEMASAQPASWLSNITKLELDDILISWELIVGIRSYFSNLETLTASSNYLKSLSCQLKDDSLVSLALENNEFESLEDLHPLTKSKSLKTLLLKGNKINRVTRNLNSVIDMKFGNKVEYVDLSYNAINSWSFIDELPVIFPGLTGLRISNNPLYPNPLLNPSFQDSEENFMITVGRIGTLKSLNFSKITCIERNNAEIYYLSRIAQELAEVAEDESDIVLSRHKRYEELCNNWGPPTISRKGIRSHDSSLTVEGRLIKFTFKYMNMHKEGESISTICREIPKSIDVYRVKGLVGKLFGISVIDLRLIWETGEWDPVAGYEFSDMENSDDDDDDDITLTENDRFVEDKIAMREDMKSRWQKREVEIFDSTRQIGSCIEGTSAIVRVELKA